MTYRLSKTQKGILWTLLGFAGYFIVKYLML